MGACGGVVVRTRVWDRWHDDASCPGQGSNHGAALISFLFLTLISFLFTKVLFFSFTLYYSKGYTKLVTPFCSSLRFFFFHTIKKGYTTAKAILRQRLYKVSLPCVVTCPEIRDFCLTQHWQCVWFNSVASRNQCVV